MKDELINKIRQLQMIISVFVFILVTVLCWDITNFEITKIQISIWGANTHTWWMWNGSIFIVSIAILFNVLWWLYKHKRLKYKKIFYPIFIASSVCLFMVGLFPTGQYSLLHDVPAFIYFFMYPLTIFTLSFLNRKTVGYGEWIKHLILSVIMIILPLVFIRVFDGMAISEIIHTIIVAIWNLSLIGKNVAS